MAHASLGTVYSNGGKTELSRESMKRAYELRDRVSDREKFYITSHYEHFYTGNLEKAISIYELWKQTYPADGGAIDLNLGVIYQQLGDFDKALASYQEGLKLQPDSRLVASQLMGLYMNTMRLDEARAVLDKGFAQGKDQPEYHSLLLQMAFLRDDSAEVQHQIEWLSSKPGNESGLLSGEERIATYHGQIAKAREFGRKASTASGVTPTKEQLANADSAVSQTEFIIGETDRAKKNAETALPSIKNNFAQSVAAMTLGAVGESARAQTVHDDLAKRFPEDTVMQKIALPVLQATIEYGRGNFAKVIDELQPVTQYEMGGFASLDPAFLRGLAYLRLNKGAEAAVEFQKLIDHRGVVGTSITGPLAHLELARTRVMINDVGGARTEYQNFFAIWKDADPDIPILKQAKAEYAKLK
jgi:tetratricopeptide (TPR) repeat protein